MSLSSPFSLHVTARLSLSLTLPIRCQLYSYQLCGSLQKRRHVFIHLTQATFTWRKAGEWKCFRLHVYLLVSGLLHAYLELQEWISGRGQMQVLGKSVLMLEWYHGIQFRTLWKQMHTHFIENNRHFRPKQWACKDKSNQSCVNRCLNDLSCC